MPGTLTLVATPIGNLADMTFRAVEALKTADRIACEDTRRSRVLCAHYGINTRLVSYYREREQERADQLLAVLLLTGNEGWAALGALAALVPYYALLWLWRDKMRQQLVFTIE